MKILIATGLYPPDVGGPAKYAKNLAEEFLRRGYQIKVLSYKLEKKLPMGLRHFWYFFRVLFNLGGTDLLIALDMLSTGFPAILAGKFSNKKTILRVGGDFLWETYVEKTGHLIKLPDFYSQNVKLPLKHKIIRYLQKFSLRNSAALAFNSHWQKELFKKFYNLNDKKLFVVENYYGEKIGGREARNKNFLFAGRPAKFKNLELVQEIFEEIKKEGREAALEIIDNLPAEKLEDKLKDFYALITLSISDFAPNFIIEGLAVNKPFILTKDCGLIERVRNLGIMVDAVDKNQIKQAVLSLLDRKIYNSYQEKINNFRFIHSWKEIADDFLNIYNSL